MLEMNSAWRFGEPGELDAGAVNEFYSLALKISAQKNSWSIIELFKSNFDGQSSRSSSEDWAKSDLRVCMHRASSNAPCFIDAFWTVCQQIKNNNFGAHVPDESVVNKILADFGEPYEIRSQSLVSRSQIRPLEIAVPEQSVDSRARAIIQKSLLQANEFLLAQKPRQAVQEIIWLLETVTTAFEGRQSGNGTVEGKYFSEIIRDLRRHNDNSALKEVIGWMTKLYGFLSSPSGGGVRHGMHLERGNVIDMKEAELFCNLTKSYIGYFLAHLSDESKRAPKAP
jgi:hypothetical protein